MTCHRAKLLLLQLPVAARHHDHSDVDQHAGTADGKQPMEHFCQEAMAPTCKCTWARPSAVLRWRAGAAGVLRLHQSGCFGSCDRRLAACGGPLFATAPEIASVRSMELCGTHLHQSARRCPPPTCNSSSAEAACHGGWAAKHLRATLARLPRCEGRGERGRCAAVGFACACVPLFVQGSALHACEVAVMFKPKSGTRAHGRRMPTSPQDRCWMPLSRCAACPAQGNKCPAAAASTTGALFS